MKIIKLASGDDVLIDDEDFETINKYHWEKHSTGKGYAIYKKIVNGVRTTILMHRLILKAQESEVIDHINGNGFDNRKENLRICSYTENARNRKINKNNKYGYKGVEYVGKRNHNHSWRARIGVDGKDICIGFYYTLIDAAKAYDEAAIKYHGKFANLNFK